MDKKSKEKELRGLFINKARKKARPIVERRRAKLAKEGKELSREEENKIIRKVSKKIKKEYTVRGLFLAMGLSAGIAGTKLLNEVNNVGITQTENSINIDAIKAGKDVYIENDSKDNKYTPREIFLNNNKVDLDAQTNEIKENVTEEIDGLKNKKDVLNYVKDIYAEEYNETNGNNITKKDISISKEIFLVEVKKDKAKNGDDILRYEYGSEGYPKGIYTIQVKTGNGIETQVISRDSSNKKVRVYDSEETVEEYKENEASKLANVIMSGTDYGIALEEKENNPVDTMDTYKTRFVNAITENREKKINKIVEGKNKENNKNNDEIIFEAR